MLDLCLKDCPHSELKYLPILFLLFFQRSDSGVVKQRQRFAGEADAVQVNFFIKFFDPDKHDTSIILFVSGIY